MNTAVTMAQGTQWPNLALFFPVVNSPSTSPPLLFAPLVETLLV